MILQRERLRRALLLYLAATTVFYVLFGLTTIAFWGWRELFADQWRLYKFYLGLPFPANIVFLENGHRPVLPGIVRVAEIHIFHGNQRLQLFIGALLALATFALIAWRIIHDKELSAIARSCGVTLTAVAIFWLANVRTLVHGNESVHAYLLTTYLCAAVILTHSAISRSRNEFPVASPGVWTRLALASLCAIVSTFSFGSGIGAFVSVAALLVIARMPARYLLPVALGLTTALLIYFALPRGNAVLAQGTLFSPLLNIRYAAQWIASPAIYLVKPFVDVHSPMWPPVFPIKNVSAFCAQRVNEQFGWVMHWVWPQALIGIAGFGALLVASLKVWRERRLLGNTETLGFGLAWFGMAVALLIGVTRGRFFQNVPEDVYAYRYLVWPCLFWLGLGLIGIGWRARITPGNASAEVSGARRVARITQGAVITISILALATEFGWWQYVRHV
ncbi:MAG: hypothetical protein ABI882_24640, partial [Acidobacteriota bacterium]